LHNTTHTKRGRRKKKTKEEKNSWDSSKNTQFFGAFFFNVPSLNLVEYIQKSPKKRG
jgi:hypothetical protein